MDQKALYNLTYGVYFLSAFENGKDNASIINTAVQVANNPTKISIAVIKGNLTHDMIMNTKKCNISSITQSAEFDLFKHFGMQSGREVDKFKDFSDIKRSSNGLYYLTKWSNAYISLKVCNNFDLGSHTLFICEMEDAEVLNNEPCCTYGYYQTVIKANAQKPQVKKGYMCNVCSFVYEGENMPDDYICPICKHPKEDFSYFEIKDKKENSKFVCSVCGYVHIGAEAPEQCPQCKVGKEKFVEQKGKMTWAAEHVVGVAFGAPEDIIADLRANFEGECTEVGMYLAMSRVAHREGYPEIGLYWEKAALEEAEHAAKFAELLGEVVTDSTKKNLEMRVEAENGATAGKFDLAKRAKELNLDAIHDTVHEMARDEARHGKAFQGLLERYFGKLSE